MSSISRPVSLSGCALLLAACSMNPLPPEPPQATSAPSATAQAAPAPSALSYGTVTSQVQKGKTTQADLLGLFGGPNISTTDAQGLETWVYERSVTQTDIDTRSQAMAGAVNLGLFFNSANLAAGASGNRSSSSTSMATSFRSLTVIVKFDANKTVADYSARASSF